MQHIIYKTEILDSKKVRKMNPDFSWIELDQEMTSRRDFHRSIRIDNQIFHVGGDGLQKIEVWELEDDSNFSISVTKFQTNGWKNYPFLFIIDVE